MSPVFSINSLAVAFIFFLVLISCDRRPEKNEFDSTFKKADSMSRAGAKRASMRFVDSSYRSKNSISPYSLYRKYYFKKMFYYYENIFDSSDIYIDSMLYALEHYNISKDYPGEYDLALNAKGDYYYSRNDLTSAFEYYYKSRIAALSSEDTCAFGNHSYHLGMVTYRQKKFHDAIAYFHTSIAENRYCNDPVITFYREEELLNNIALSYTGLGLLDSASLYYDKALALLEKYKPEFGETITHFTEKAQGVIFGNQAKIYIARGIADTAEQLLRKSIALNIKPGNENSDAQLSQIQLAELYYQQNRSPLPLLREIRQQLDTLPNKEVELRWQLLMYHYHQRMQQPMEALSYVREYMALKDSLESVNTVKQTDVGQLLKYQDSEYRMTLLQKDNQLRRLYSWFAIGFAAMVIAIIALVYINYQKSRKNVKTLTLLNRQINEQNEQLGSAMVALKENSLEKDRIMRVVAHDLRGPIGGVAYLTERVLRSEHLDAEDRTSLTIVKNASFSSLNLINDLLDQKNKLEEKEPVDINELVRLSVKMLQFRAGEKNQQLKLTETDGSPQAFIDKDKLSRVLTNLVTNAIKFSAPGALIGIETVEKDGSVVISVRDRGIGIPEGLKPFIFDIDSSARRTGTGGEKSYGLGLSITRQIIESYKGRVWFESEAGKGTTFYVSLPLVDAASG